MQEIFKELLVDFIFEGNLGNDSLNFLIFHKKADVAEHSKNVAFEAERLADKFGVEKEKALKAGFLHDLGNIIPFEDMIKTSLKLGITLVPEEETFPALLHPKISNYGS